MSSYNSRASEAFKTSEPFKGKPVLQCKLRSEPKPEQRTDYTQCIVRLLVRVNFDKIWA